MKYKIIVSIRIGIISIFVACSSASENKPSESTSISSNSQIFFNVNDAAQKYMLASLQHKGDIAIEYIYPKVFNLLYERNKDQFQSIEEVKIFYKSELNKVLDNMPDVDYSMTYKIDTILKKVSVNENTILIRAKSTLKTNAKDNKGKQVELSLPDTLIGVTYDKGINWYFINKGEMIKEALRLEFSDVDISTLLN